MWTCPNCDSNNDSSSDRCFVCGEKRITISGKQKKASIESDSFKEKPEEVIKKEKYLPTEEKSSEDKSVGEKTENRLSFKPLLYVFIIVVVIFSVVVILNKRKENNDSSEKLNESEDISEVAGLENTSEIVDLEDEIENIDIESIESTWLTDLEYFYNTGVTIKSNSVGTANTGETYSHYIFGNADEEIQYYLNGKYEYLSGLWTICQVDSNTNVSSSFEIYADDKLVYSSPIITGGDTPFNIETNIDNCVILKIVFTSGDGSAEFGNIRISPGDDSYSVNKSIEMIDENKNWLTDIDYLVNNGVSIKDSSTGISNTNENYSHYLFGSEGDDIQYYLEGRYSYISGIWCICQVDRDTNDQNSFEIYADDELVYQSPSITGGELPIAFTVDIKKCQKLRIVFTQGDGAGEMGNVYLE